MLCEQQLLRYRHLRLSLRRQRLFRIHRWPDSQHIEEWVEDGGSRVYEGLMEVSFWPLLLLTHSLLMKRPVGWVYFRPLGAVSSIERSDISFDVLLLKCLLMGNLSLDADVAQGPQVA